MALEWDTPSKATVTAYVRALTRRRREHTHQATEKQEMLDLFDRYVPEDAGNERRETVGRLAGQLAAARRRIESIDGLLARATEDPSSLFLPVGAVVRMRPPARPDTWDGGRDAPPVPGSLGVVVGPVGGISEWSLLVAFTEYTDAYGTRWDRDAGTPRRLYLDADDLEVVSLGTFLDGTPCRAVEFVRTHARPEDDEAQAMVVESNGATWVVELMQPGRDQWLEVQGWEAASDLDYLVPVDGSAPAPRGRSPARPPARTCCRDSSRRRASAGGRARYPGRAPRPRSGPPGRRRRRCGSWTGGWA